MFKDEDSDKPSALFIVGQGTSIRCEITKDADGSATVRGAYVTLIACYYAFNLEYPKMYCGALVMIQEHMMNLGEYTLYTPTGYKRLATRLKRVFRSMEKEQQQNNEGSPSVDSLIR